MHNCKDLLRAISHKSSPLSPPVREVKLGGGGLGWGGGGGGGGIENVVWSRNRMMMFFLSDFNEGVDPGEDGD